MGSKDLKKYSQELNGAPLIEAYGVLSYVMSIYTS